MEVRHDSFPSSLLLRLFLIIPFPTPTDFAGNAAIFGETCPGVCYTDYVVGNGSNYNTAYFEVASVRVFSKHGTNTIVKDNSAGTARVATLGIVLGALSVVGLTML